MEVAHVQNHGLQMPLPAIHEHPRIEFAPPAKIASLRFTDLLSDPKAQVEPNNRASSAQHDTIAIYYDATRTIYLPEGWTAATSPDTPSLTPATQSGLCGACLGCGIIRPPALNVD